MTALLALLLLTTPQGEPRPAIVPEIVAEADGTRTLRMETVVGATADKAWTMIATPEGWRRWAAPVARVVPGEEDMLETSYAEDAKPGDATTIRQHFVAWIPGRMLAFRTVKAPEGFPHFETYKKVITVIELSPAGEGRTRIALTAVNYPDDAAGRALLDFFRKGNAETLVKLRDALEASDD